MGYRFNMTSKKIKMKAIQLNVVKDIGKRNIFYLLSVSLLFILLKMTDSYAIDFSRNELIEEGKRALQAFERYEKIIQKPSILYIDFNFNTTSDYQIDTSSGYDSANILLLNMNLKLGLPDRFTLFYFMDYFGLNSWERYTYETNDDGERDKAKYAELFRHFFGYRWKMENGFVYTIGLIVDKQKLWDTQPATIPLFELTLDEDGYVVDEEGRRIYDNPMIQDSTKWSPFFGFNLFGFYDLKIQYSTVENSIDSYKSFFQYSTGSKLGIFELGDIYYKFWNNDHGIVLKWNEALKYFSLNVEYLYKGKYFSNTGLESYFPLTGLITMSNGTKYQLWVHAVVNYSRSPDIEYFTKSSQYLFGWKLGLEVHFNGPILYLKAYKNNYQELISYRGAIDKLGGLFGISVPIGTPKKRKTEKKPVSEGDIIENEI